MRSRPHSWIEAREERGAAPAAAPQAKGSSLRGQERGRGRPDLERATPYPRLQRAGMEDVPRDIDQAELRRRSPRPDNRELAVRAERASHEIARWLARGRGHGIQRVERDERGLPARAPDRAVDLPGRVRAGTMVNAEAELLAVRRNREPAVAVTPRLRRDVLSRPGLAVIGRVEE